MTAFEMRMNLVKAAFLKTPRFNISVMSNQETLDYIIENEASIIRFGDGEVNVMCGDSITYQVYEEELAESLKKILNSETTKKLLVCLPNVFDGLKQYSVPVRLWWKRHLKEYEKFYKSISSEKHFGSTGITRPYMDHKKPQASITANNDFKKLKSIFCNQDLLIVEGFYSRTGMGNDLLDEANSVSRILCPSKDAFSKFNEILENTLKFADCKLVLISLGPTAKLLAYELAQKGIRALDIGHIDSEYEWFKMGVKKKVKLNNKHTAEWNYDDHIEDNISEQYKSQVIANISK